MFPLHDNAAPAGDGKLRILVVDDEPTLRLGFAYALTSRSTTVETASTGREALEKIAAGSFDIVVLDLRMPDLDGIGVIEELRGRGNKIPVVLCSAALSPGAAIRAIRNCVVDFLLKPVRPVDLRDMVRFVTVPETEPLPAGLQAARDGRIQDAIRILEDKGAVDGKMRCWHRLLTAIRDADGLGNTSALEEQARRSISTLAFNSTVAP